MLNLIIFIYPAWPINAGFFLEKKCINREIRKILNDRLINFYPLRLFLTVTHPTAFNYRHSK